MTGINIKKNLRNDSILMKLLTALLVVTLAAVPCAGVFAAPLEVAPEATETAFDKISGEITLIHEWDGQPCIRITDADGGETDFIIEAGKTVLSGSDGLIAIGSVTVGKKADAYFVKPLIMTMQYPPRFKASVLVTPDADNPGAVFVGVVNDKGLASDSSVSLNVKDDALIVRQSDELAFRGPLAGRPIIAYYTITTRSMPPIALVEKVIVLDKMGVPVYVNGVKLFNAEVVFNGDGVAMAPLRAIVEAQGYDVNWDDIECAARVGVAIYVKIGSDEYLIGRAAPIKLDAAAELINDRTYAPLSFYQQLLNMTLDDSAGLIKLTSNSEDSGV